MSAGLWDAEPGMEPEPGLVKPRSGRQKGRRRGPCWRVDRMKNHQWQGVSANYPPRAVCVWGRFGGFDVWKKKEQKKEEEAAGRNLDYRLGVNDVFRDKECFG